ncbi:hypothetical protein D3C76_1483800 [compost metagenome]
MRVDRDNFFAFRRFSNFHERFLQRFFQLVIHDRRIFAYADSVVVNRLCYTDNVGLIPDRASAAVLSCPFFFIVTACVCKCDNNVSLSGSKAGKGASVRIGLCYLSQVSQALAVFLLQPQCRIDVAGRG